MSITDHEYGIEIEHPFLSRKTANAEITSVFRSKTTPANPPSFEIRRFDDVLIADNPAGSITWLVNQRPGMHLLKWDTAASVQATPGRGYRIICTDGEIEDGQGGWFDATGDVVDVFNLRGGAAGYLASRVIELLQGTVVSVVAANQFTVSISGRDHSGPPFAGVDMYSRLGASFQSGNLKGISRNILRSVTTAENVTLVFEDSFPLSPAPNDIFALIPEEQAGPIAIAHISANPHTGEYYVTWTRNQRQVIPDGQVTLSAKILDTGATLFNDAVMSKTTDFGYYYENTQDLAPANSGIELTAKATFDGVPVTGWPRIYPRTA